MAMQIDKSCQEKTPILLEPVLINLFEYILDLHMKDVHYYPWYAIDSLASRNFLCIYTDHTLPQLSISSTLIYQDYTGLWYEQKTRQWATSFFSYMGESFLLGH